MKIGLVILTKNEIQGVQAIIPKIPREVVDELFAVDGNSTDGTREYFESVGIKVLAQTSPGRGEAFRIAVKHTVCDALIFFSPDGNEDPADIPKFREYLEKGADLVIASRMMKGAHNEEDDKTLPIRKWVNQLFTLAANILWNRGPYITDTINGFRAVTVEAFKELAPDGRGYTIEYQSSIRAFKKGMKIAEFPTYEGERIGEGGSPALPTGLAFIRLFFREIGLSIKTALRI